MADTALASPASRPEPVVTTRRFIAFAALVFGMFMAIMDIQIVSSSLSQIQAGLSAAPNEVSWVQTSYLIAEVVMIPLSGFLSRALSTRVLFTISAAGFTLASALCASATSLNQMIVYRALQGFIGGGMIPTAFAASYIIFPKRLQGPVMAVVGLTVTLAPTIGPTIGGYLTELLSWHWLFLINVPPGIAATLLAWFLVDFDEPDYALLRRFDFLGLATMTVFLGSLQYVLEEGQTNDWFADEAIVLMAALAAGGAVAFFWRTFTARTPIVDLSTYRDRNFAVGSLLTFVLGIGLYGLTYLYPLYLARIRNYTSLQIGETVFVTGAAMFCTAPIVGNLVRRVDPRKLIGLGLAGFAASTYMVTPLTADWAFGELFWPQAFRGVALMLCMIPINTIALGTLPPDRVKNASGLFNLTRNLGGAVGLATINTVLQSRTDLHYQRLAEQVRWGSVAAEERLADIAAGLSSSLGPAADGAALARIAGMVRQQATVMAFADVFLMLAVMFSVTLLLVPLVQRPQAAAEGVGGH
ncbi:MFS transporter [Haematobacter massiliensis]|uniref:MFS transporter n=1 Tax=Haematobacter massiliensis TaxID=195105 RepID=A0A086XW24_9RHOB|nr:DHA2 family efflux MFS transporter permease subunit [Haematobacter massiliensis]KFI26224.1 MFS transporter [Haematobacter massiliensis]OWJ70113.1 MFS transporter [Haematobacter massiliensis]OWJ87086.1 MFS transporter [Haematobacter massiliensis]QBJ24642.1 DHA2 family efflux MFS transporter permease subunit [Haematobacter massiliensis]